MLEIATDAVMASARALLLRSTLAGNSRYHMTSKMPHVLEGSIQALDTGLNCGQLWTFGDEDFVGQLGRSCSKLHRSTAQNSLILRAVDQVRVELGS